MKANKFIAAISTVIMAVGVSQAAAQEVQPGIFQVATGESQKIDRFGVCRVIKNDGENPIMVPAGGEEQWSTGAGSFLQNTVNMPGVSVTTCEAWHEGRSAVTIVRDFSGTPSVHTWLDGTETRIAHGFGLWTPIPSDLSYNPDTGECSPRKSPIAVLGPVAIFNPQTGEGFYAIQLCESDGIATSPYFEAYDG